MRDDLLDAQAAVDWAVAQFPPLQERMNAWIELNIEVIVKDPDPSGPNNVIIAVQKELLPRTFNVEIGLCLNALRTSLDILATVLAYRHCMVKPDDAYFPIAASPAAFKAGNYKGAKFVKGLPVAQHALIEGLKPYKGGNELLWSLHNLDITRKHRRLLTVVIDPYFFAVIGAGAQKFTPLPTGFVRTDNVGQKEVILGSIAKDAPEYQTQFAPYIALDEAAIVNRRSLDRAFSAYVSLATEIIRLFDTS
jgi:hypothetical protein